MKRDNSQKFERPTDKRRKGRNSRSTYSERFDGSAKKEELSQNNDWRWYAANPQLLRDTASYPYVYPLGNPIDYGPQGLDANKWALPGICTISVAPIIGYSDQVNSPINVASRSLYSALRHKNSGSWNYEAPDLMIMLMAMDSGYYMLEFLKRIYGVAMTASYTNRYYPKAVIESMYVDYDDIRRNLADFRAMINTFVVKLSSICVPATLPIMFKHQWLFKGLYLDQPIDKAQTYMFIPSGYYTYQLDDDSAGMLKWNRYDVKSKHTMAELEAIMNSIVDPILSGVGTQDFNVISGDILKAFEGNIVKLDVLTDDYRVFPEYRPEVLDQIQNLTLMGTMDVTGTVKYPASFKGNDIRQSANKDYLVQTPKFINRVSLTWAPNLPEGVTVVAGDNCFTTNRIVTFDHGDIGPENTIEATRMTNIASKIELVADNTYGQLITSDTLGSEVATVAQMWRYELDDNGVLNLIPSVKFDMSWTFLNIVHDINETTIADVADAWIDMYDQMNRLTTQLGYFHRHFPVAITAGMFDDVNKAWNYDSFNGYTFDVNYYTTLERQDLKSMSETALLSEFNVRQPGAGFTG